jgi:hypothetical protein
MANTGQPNWNLRGAATNEYIVNPRISKDIYYQSEYATLFGRLNGGREVKITEIERGDKKMQINAGGNDSPVWEQDFQDETGEARFTCQEPLAGLETYGTADVKPGQFTGFKHEVVYAIQADSPVYPIIDTESQMRQTELISVADVIPGKKREMTLWREKQVELNAFRAITDGASRSLLYSSDGGMAIALPGATAGQNRSCYNTWVANQSALTTPNYTRTTHEGTLATLLASVTNNDDFQFTYELHKQMSYQVSHLKFKPITIGNSEYRAGCIIDPRLIERLVRVSGSLATLYTYAMPRSDKNPALDGLQTIELDGILYIPSMYMEYFRPVETGGLTTAYLPSGADPFDSSFANTSNLCMAFYFGAGALLRGRRKKVWFTVSGEGASDAGHKKGTTFCLHYYDGWKRTEWVTKDGRSEMYNDSSLMLYCYDPGVGIAFSA